MYIQDYLWFLLALSVCMLFAGYASRRVHGTYAKYSSVLSRSRLTGYDTARRLLSANEIYDISIGRTSGELSDHYHPTKQIVNLSEDTYNSSSIAAIAVAAHEIGHVVQNKSGYLFYKVRTALVPIVNFGSHLAMPLVLVGLLLDMGIIAAGESGIGFNIAMIGVLLYGASFLFTVVTLPVELNASRRARKMLVAEGILTESEMDDASEVLSAAALTYVASLLTSLVYFLRFLLYVLAMFGRRRDR